MIKKLNFAFIFICIITFVFLINILGKRNLNEQANNLNDTIRKDIISCYAIEGQYPPSIDYLKEHYGLNYNEDIFYVDYIPIGSNIMPDYTVICIGK